VTIFCAGDRIRVERTGDDGLPLVRYGFVGGSPSGTGPIVVMLDGDLNGSMVEPHELRHVELTTVELNLSGADLLDEPELRRGLVALWQAEADTAGLEVGRLRPIGDGLRDSNDSWALAELTFGDQLYVVHAIRLTADPNAICVRADQAR
jgi:hypothetical protein